MLIINKGTTNQLIMTLTEKQTLTSPYFLFEFKSDVSMVAVYFLMADISIHTNRYNEFTFIEGTTKTLSPTGQWTYRVWEQSSSTNLAPSLATTLLETGQIRVVGTADIYYENTNLDNTFYINE